MESSDSCKRSQTQELEFMARDGLYYQGITQNVVEDPMSQSIMVELTFPQDWKNLYESTTHTTHSLMKQSKPESTR